MLDIKKIKENPDAVKAGLRAKEVDCDATVDRILELDAKIRTLKTNTETQTAQKNKLAKENGKLFGMKKKAEKEGKDVSELDAAIAANNAQSVQIAEAIEQELAELKTLSDEYRVAMLSLPNLPDPDLKPGGKENNEPLRYFGEPHKFDFTPKHHVDLCEGLGLIDYDRGVKLAGSGFWMYKGMGARLEWALLNYFIDCHIADGYEFILPPHMLEYQCGETAGQFPKFADEVYKISNPTDDRVHYMLPTAEAALCSIYRDEILTEAELPRKFFAYLPDPDLKPGGKENNEPLRYFGEPHKFDFTPKHHVDLCEGLGLIDYDRGVKLAGSGFWMYKGMGARLEWALLNYFIDCHIADGYEFILPPHMLEYQCGETAGQFPKFADEVYKISNPTDDRVHYMLPTAEAALCSIYRDEILTEAELPRKFFAYTPCFRREAGSGHADERGMVRGHQFNKVEMFQFTRPEDSDAAFEELVRKAENLVKGLGFHFRTVKLAAGDCSASMARTYDIEIQIPSMNGYKEVSSVSNARDYQARRGNIRFRREATGKPEFVHTLNGSGLATSRIFPAMVEQNQRADGSVVVPEVLRKYLGGIEVIEKK